MAFSKLLLTCFIASLTNLHFGMAEKPMAILYENEDKAGLSINYFEDVENFGHVQSIVDRKNLSGITLFCATGVFILYNEEEYDSEKDEDINILAGTDTCLPPGSVKSLMFAQSALDTTLDSITAFTSERFGGGLPLKIHSLSGFNDASLMMMGNIKSFILMGKSGWTVTTRHRIFCIKPGTDSEFPVCPVPYSRKMFLPEEETWLSVRRGCDETSLLVTASPLTYCFNHGSGSLEPISSGSEEAASSAENTTMGEIPTSGRESSHSNSPLESCDATDEFSMLLRVRLTHDFQSSYQVQFPFNKAHSWRTEILDFTMEILGLGTRDKLVDRDFLHHVREMYVYLAEKVAWTEGKGWPTKPLERVLLMGHETGRCLTNMVANKWVDVALEFSDDVIRKQETSEIKNKDIDPVFHPVKGYDLVMEFIWLAINFVGAACHAVLEYATDFWMDYMNVAYNMYLQPMAEFWGAPKNVLKYYPIILGGFGIEKQYRGLAAATTSLYQAVSLDKLQRPVEVEKSANENH